MIGKTTGAAEAVTQTIRRAIAHERPSAGFAAELKKQAESLASAASALVDGANADPKATAARAPVGGRTSPEAAASARTPVGERTGATGAPTTNPDPVGAAPSTESRPNLSTADVVVNTTGTLSEDPRTEGMYVPPDFYHGTSYSPVFDTVDENGNVVRTPRFEGQQIYSDWRGSLPDDFDLNARVLRDPQTFGNSASFWKKGEDGTWVKRETGYDGIPLYDDGKPVFTPDPVRHPEYFKV